jgi:hypothetical protein
MKVLLYHLTPLALECDDWQLQILATREALRELGVDVEFLRWYDGNQTGEILHFFGRTSSYLIGFARQKRMKVVVSEAPAGRASGSRLGFASRRMLMGLLQTTLPGPALGTLDWDSYRQADACVAATPADALRLTAMFRVPPERVHVITNAAPPGKPDAQQLKSLYETLVRTSR